MAGRAFFWGLLSILVVALGFAVWSLVGTFERFGKNENAQREEVARPEAPPADATPAEEAPREAAAEDASTGAPAAPAPRTAREAAAPQGGTARPGTEPGPPAGPAPPADSDLAAPSEDAAPDRPDEGETESAALPPPGEPPLPRRRPTRDAAPAFELRAPISCDPGRDCWVSTYFDHDTGPGRRDHACGPISYHTHGGIDFAIANLAVMGRGVPVLASAAGKVVGTRRDMADINMDDADPASIKGRDCGNGVRIDHGNGWSTQYCHLKRDSLTVRSGDQVAAGDKIGLVGLSGRTQHPHVHLSVMKDGERIDPYTGGTAGAHACGDTGGSLWSAETARDFPYRTGLIRDAIFATRVPDRREVKAGTAGSTSGSTNAEALVIWVETMGTLKDHSIYTKITAPGGETALEETLTDPKLYAARYVGLKRPRNGWPAGTYRGEIEIRNGAGQVTDRREITIDLN